VDVDFVEAVDLALQLGQDLHDDVIAVLLGEVLRDLTLTECIIEGVVDELRGEPVAGGLIPIDGERQGGTRHLLIGGHVAQHR
jgi:hypothetical protein